MKKSEMGPLLPRDWFKAVLTAPTPLALLSVRQIVYTNQAFSDIYGDCHGESFDYFFGSESMDQLDWLLAGTHKESDKIVLPLKDTISRGPSGSHVLVQLWPLDDTYCLLSLQENYSLRRLADIDELTRLPNRRKAMMLLDIEKLRANRSAGFCLALGDIDHFKNINDTYGHNVGDFVLQQVAQIMTSLLRAGDWVARWGGEEFMVFTNDSDIVTGLQPLERIRRKMEETKFDKHPQLKVTVSFGFVAGSGRQDVRDLISKADMLLYDAKNNGRNRIEIEKEEGTVWIAEDIKQAVAEHKLQPVTLPLCSWDGGEAPMCSITPYLLGQPYQEVEKMLAVADRLREQVLVYHDMLQSVNRAGAVFLQSARYYYFPVYRNLFNDHEADLIGFFERYPMVCPGIDAMQVPPDTMLSKILSLRRPVVLFNSDAERMPSFLLGLDNLAYIVFAQTGKNTPGVVSLFAGSSVRCYAALTADAPAARKTALQEMGFDGFLAVPAADTVVV